LSVAILRSVVHIGGVLFPRSIEQRRTRVFRTGAVINIILNRQCEAVQTPKQRLCGHFERCQMSAKRGLTLPGDFISNNFLRALEEALD
jgi:hypothetical protein